LSLYLRAIEKIEFEESRIDQEKLSNFVLESFKIVLNYEQKKTTTNSILDIPSNVIKNTLDHITIGIKVPSISKYNIVNDLDLRKLLK
jgi:hypothetical protein